MSSRMLERMLLLGLLVVALLLIGESVVATASPSPTATKGHAFESPLSSVHQPAASLSPAAVGMRELMSQTFEFADAFPVGWQAYAVTYTLDTANLNYVWATTTYTQFEGARSAIAVGLTDTTSYTDAVDAWMVYGPVDLSAVWQAQLDFWYSKPAVTGVLTVAVSTNYDPIGRMGTFVGKALTPTAGWASDTLDLSPYAGRSVYVAFQYQSPDGGNVADGPFVDDVHLRVNYRVFMPIIHKWTLTLSKVASASYVRAGDTLVYSITVGNTSSPDAVGVVLTDTVPVSTTFVSADGGGVYDSLSRVVTWSNLTVPANSSIELHMTVAIPGSFPFGTRFVNDNYAITVPPNPIILYGRPVTVPAASEFFDDFSNPASGWGVGEYTPPGGNICVPPPGAWRAGYLSNGAGYGVNTLCVWNGKLYPAPVRIADPAYFTLTTDMRSNQGDLWYSSYGVFFNASEDLRQTYIVRLFQGFETDPEWAAYYWPNFQGSSDDQPPPEVLWMGECYACTGADFAWNQIVIRRQGAYFEVWMGTPGNVARMRVFNDARLVDHQHVRVGVHHGNFEWGYASGYAYVFDNFRLALAIR